MTTTNVYRHHSKLCHCPRYV